MIPTAGLFMPETPKENIDTYLEGLKVLNENLHQRHRSLPQSLINLKIKFVAH